ncbi:MAG: tRNA (cytidine(56)-2'-O)-methyltransferase [Candidatus Hodarchaeales archaeon]|jgi:tRNA (cytidine56-2'-O)-methyltransferase
MNKLFGYHVLRLNHRIKRDKRTSTHVGLVARAFGARGFIYSGEPDPKLERSLIEVKEGWGGREFEITFWDDWINNCNLLISTGTVIVHLTMYGDPLQSLQNEINNIYYNKKKNIIFIVGGAKVPPEIYKIAHFNVSVTKQPHSEIAALAVTLDRIFPTAINT